MSMTRFLFWGKTYVWMWVVGCAALFVVGGVWYVMVQRANEVQRQATYAQMVQRLQGVMTVPEHVCDIRDYGAVAGTTALVTDAIAAAIADCASRGGGTVQIPAGTWHTGGIRLASNIHMYLAEDAVLSFSTDVQDYLPTVLTRIQGIEVYNFAPLIYAADSENIAITGSGTLVGNGEARTQWDAGGAFADARARAHTMAAAGMPVEERQFGLDFPGFRPSFVQCVHCTNFLLDGITIENGPFWTVHPVYVDGVTVRNVRIHTWSGNTDGIALDSCRNVVIEDSYFSTGDDAISIKSGMDTDGWRVNMPTEHVQIRNIVVEKGSAGVSIGSEMSGGVRDVEVRDSHFSGTRHGFRIKSTKSRGGFIEDVVARNIVMDHMSGDAIDINLTYSSDLQDDATRKPRVRHVTISDITGTGGERLGVNIETTPNPDMENVRVERVRFTDFARGTDVDFARGVTLSDIAIDAAQGPQFTVAQSQNIVVENSACGVADSARPCVSVEGNKSQGIIVRQMDTTSSAHLVHFAAGASRRAVRVEQ